MKRSLSLSFAVALALLATQASGAMVPSGPGLSLGHIAPGSVSMGNVTGAHSLNGITFNGITVLANGTVVVPAVIPRGQTINVAPILLNQLPQKPEPVTSVP